VWVATSGKKGEGFSSWGLCFGARGKGDRRWQIFLPEKERVFRRERRIFGCRKKDESVEMMSISQKRCRTRPQPQKGRGTKTSGAPPIGEEDPNSRSRGEGKGGLKEKKSLAGSR